MALAASMLLMAACGETEDPNASTGNGAEDKSQTEQTADDTQESGAYVFVYNGVTLAVDADAAEAVAALGDPSGYYEESSCAFEGLDKVYTYPNIEIDTYPSGDSDLISEIIIKDDLVSTPEGVSLYMTFEDMVNAYGSDYTEGTNLYTYSRGGMTLRFIVKDNEIVSIEYLSSVLN